jgi:Trm5-related predicted tRNA methylase
VRRSSAHRVVLKVEPGLLDPEGDRLMRAKVRRLVEWILGGLLDVGGGALYDERRT